MNIKRYDPWHSLSQWQDEVGRLLGRSQDDSSSVATSQWVPAVDIIEEPARFILQADIPGVDPKDIEVFMEDGLLTVKGERKSEKTVEKEGYRRVERRTGTFYRRFALPDTADAENIKAQGRHGVLEITIPKREKNKSRKIAVES